MLTQNEHENLVGQCRRLVERWVAKHRRENVHAADPEEYATVWAEAVLQSHPAFAAPRAPGRPRKCQDGPASVLPALE